MDRWIRKNYLMEINFTKMRFQNNDSITEALKLFRDFLNESWPVVKSLAKEHDWDNDAYFFEDWFDQNWLLLVGRQLLGKTVDLQPLCVGINDVKNEKHRFCIRTQLPVVGTFISLGTGEDSFSLDSPFDKIKILRDDGVEEVHPFSTAQFQVLERRV
jgi:hypothetical protein